MTHRSTQAGTTLLNVIRIAVQRGAVVYVAQGVKDVRINSILNVMHRSVGEDGVDPSRVGRAKLVRRRPACAAPPVDVDVLVRIRQGASRSRLLIIARI